MSKTQLSEKQLRQRGEANQRHGGESAVKAIQRGEVFQLGTLARDAELAVYNELESSGRYALVVRSATRLQACCDLFWNAIEAAAQNGDLEQLDRYIKRFGWLASSALRAWAQVRAESADGHSDLIVDAIAAAKEVGTDGHQGTD